MLFNVHSTFYKSPDTTFLLFLITINIAKMSACTLIETEQSASHLAGFDKMGRGDMRQIEEFSNDLRYKANVCMAWTAVLVVWVWVSVLLHFRDNDIRVVYTVVAVTLGIQIFRSAVRLHMEESRTARMYKNYLNTFSYQVLDRMRSDPKMSAWSKREIAKYLKEAMILGY